MRGAKISTRYEVGVLNILHDLGGGAKIIHDYTNSRHFNVSSNKKICYYQIDTKNACNFKCR